MRSAMDLAVTPEAATTANSPSPLATMALFVLNIPFSTYATLSEKSFRVEISPSNRAACRSDGCTWNGGKIGKNELRLAEEIHYPGRLYTGWGWRHWGCVSVVLIADIQTAIKLDEDIYDWDKIEGYGNLGEQQEKFRRVIMQGHVDPEDLRADPGWKMLGGKGTAKKSAASDKKSDGDKGRRDTLLKAKGKKYQPGTPYGSR